MYTAIYKINYFIPLKPLYIRRERNKKLFPKLACHKLCFFSPRKLLLHLWECLEQITLAKKTSSIHLLFLFI